MTFWSSDRVAEVLRTPRGSPLRFTAVSTDTRTLAPGALFVALAGERFDGHDFVEEAKRCGARGAVVRRGTPPVQGLALYEVEDTLSAFGLLARERRRGIEGAVVAVTGTNGKTATKEMVAGALATRWKVHATHENQNNLIGVPLTILSAPDNCEGLVIEAGASLPGEMSRLRAVIDPTVGVVTNVSAGHLEGFGSFETVLHEKTLLVQQIPLAVVGPTPPALAERARALASRVVTAGLVDSADLRPDAWGLHGSGRGWCVFRGVRVELPVVGRHQIENATLALAVAHELGLDLESVGRAVAATSLPPGRCEVLRRGGVLVLQDTYNANPGSVTALLDTARAMRLDRPLVVVLGSMLELGSESARLHAEVASAVMEGEPQLVAVLGEFVPAFDRYADQLGDRLLVADDADALGKEVAARLAGDELVVVKGSRGVHLERAIPHLFSSDETPCSTIS